MKPTVRVFLLAGQSNMVGSDADPERIDDHPAFVGAGASRPEVRFATLADDPETGFRGWEPLGPRGAFGPELTFARRLLARDRAPLALIKSAVGGTTAARDWHPDAPESGQRLYPRTLRLVREALAALAQEGVPHRLEGVLWHQGENDMLDPRLRHRYAARLAELIARLRADLGVPDLPWFVGEVSTKGIWGMDHRAPLSVLRAQQRRVCDDDPAVFWVPTSHLAFAVMGHGQPHYHFGTQGQLQLGEAFADAVLARWGKATASPARPLPRGAAPSRGQRVRLFVLAGQRTMEGEDAFAAQIGLHPEGRALAGGTPDVLFRYHLGGGVLRSRGWEPLGLVDPRGNFGPEVSLAAGLRRALPGGERIALAKFTHSGAQIPDWAPEGSAEPERDLYAGLIAFVRDAVSDLERRGCAATVEGVFWHPGGNDTWFAPYRNAYAERLRALVGRVRADLGRPALPWFVSEQHPRAPWEGVAILNAGLRRLASEDPHLHVVPTAALEHGRFRFGTRGTLQLGDAYARAWASRG